MTLGTGWTFTVMSVHVLPLAVMVITKVRTVFSSRLFILRTGYTKLLTSVWKCHPRTVSLGFQCTSRFPNFGNIAKELILAATPSDEAVFFRLLEFNGGSYFNKAE